MKMACGSFNGATKAPRNFKAPNFSNLAAAAAVFATTTKSAFTMSLPTRSRQRLFYANRLQFGKISWDWRAEGRRRFCLQPLTPTPCRRGGQFSAKFILAVFAFARRLFWSTLEKSAKRQYCANMEKKGFLWAIRVVQCCNVACCEIRYKYS